MVDSKYERSIALCADRPVHRADGCGVQSQQSAESTAIDAKNRMDQYLDHPSHPLPIDRVCILIQNFGDHRWGGWSAFQHDADKVSADRTGDGQADWPDSNRANPANCGIDNDWEPCHPERFQPWMAAGRQQARDWMDYFCAKLFDLIANDPERQVLPTRFHFDSEIHLATTGNPNFPFLLRMMRSDPRWAGAPVPGSGMTMEAMWAPASDAADSVFESLRPILWPAHLDPNPPHALLPEFINPWGGVLGPQVIDFDAIASAPRYGFEKNGHRDLLLWAGPIYQRALDDGMHFAAYDRVHSYFGSTCLTSNYDDVTLPAPTESTVAWAFDAPAPTTEQCGAGPCGVYPRQWMTSLPRGESDNGQHGAIHLPLSNGRWYVRANTRASGDFGSPVLYLAGSGQTLEFNPRVKVEDSDQFYFDAYRQYDTYRKPLVSGLPPRESAWQASLRRHERTLDAAWDACRSDGKLDATTYSPNLAPWILMPYASRLPYDLLDPPGYSQNFAFQPVADTRDQLMLLRAKRLREISGWDAAGFDPNAGESAYSALVRVHHQVFDPVISSIAAEYGTFLTPIDAARIDDIVVRETGGSAAPHTIVVQSQYVATTNPPNGHTEIASVKVEFSNIFVPSGTVFGLRLRIEASVRQPLDFEGELGPMPIGEIWCWKWPGGGVSGQWIAMRVSSLQELAAPSLPDDTGVVPPTGNGNRFSYWAPEDPPQGSRWHRTRRYFEWSDADCTGLRSSDGRVLIKSAHVSPIPFEMKYDLVQLASIDATPQPSGSVGEGEGAAQGADINYDGVADGIDGDVFVSAFAAGDPVADINQDATVDAPDLVEFVDLLTSGGGQ